MRLRVIDFVGNPGGGLRFASELTRALVRVRPNARIEFVSHGHALGAYREALSGCPAVGISSVRPRGRALARLRPLFRVAPLRRLARDLGAMWHFDIESKLLDGCDAIWLPWIHRHRLDGEPAARIVASLHDLTFLRAAERSPYHPDAAFVEDEEETMRRWIASSARIVVSSRSTLGELDRRFGAREERFALVPVAGDHVPPVGGCGPNLGMPWENGPFLLCPSNISMHKNHEVLLRGVARCRTRWSLVLTGEGSDLGLARAGREGSLARWLRPNHRAAALQTLATAEGFVVGIDLHPLGYVPDGDYFRLLGRAAAVVVPTLAEGGGSFGVAEAISCGVPVVCSDIPVLREQTDRLGASVVFFDPHDPGDLADKLDELSGRYQEFRERARQQAHLIGRRSWNTVAEDYWHELGGGA